MVADENEPPQGANDLAARLKCRGLTLPGDARRQKVEDHTPLEGSTIQRKLFTPLIKQGNSAVQEELRRKADDEQHLADGMRQTILRWVQECFAREGKRTSLAEKGVLKCQVQAKWSSAVNEALKAHVAQYGAVARAESESKGQGEMSDWIPKKERWIVTFDAQALHTFASKHPHVVEPDTATVWQFARDYAKQHKKDLQGLHAALEAKFGPVRLACSRRLESLLQAGSASPTMASSQDAIWAASVLAPFGLAQDGTLLVHPPAYHALPVLKKLQLLLEGSGSNLREVLRESDLGKVVNGLRKHDNLEVVALAKSLLVSWKSACNGVREQDSEGPPQKRQRRDAS
mmetsp:Transcript_9013/g.16288  ORF Transcript_9013/g.16288 Transcript_9013/m.16288 type:complete len:345 (-) Transcript_9013:119-1153(-)